MSVNELLEETILYVLRMSKTDPKEFRVVSLHYCVRKAGTGRTDEATVVAALERLQSLTKERKTATHDVFGVPEAIGLIRMAIATA